MDQVTFSRSKENKDLSFLSKDDIDITHYILQLFIFCEIMKKKSALFIFCEGEGEIKSMKHCFQNAGKI